MRFCHRYADHFRLKTRDVALQSKHYLQGLVQSPKKNMERMVEVVPNSDEQALQHFLSNSNWQERPVLDQVALEADQLIGGAEDSALLLDESGISKKGTRSVGVSRQWNGRLGKVDNCQVGVFAALSRGSFATLIDVRLYLPRKWTDNKARCDGAGIPIEAQRFKTKPELALEMIRHASALGVRYNWIGADGLYGNDPTFLRALDEQGEVFLIDVHKDQQIYLEDPEPRRVEAVQKRGRKSTRWQSESTPIRVDQWLKQRPESAWKREVLRDGTKGTVTVEILHQRVWLWDGKEAKGHHWHLLVRWEIPALNEIKYSLSNASEEVSSLKLAQMQGQRYWVERSFQDGKSHAGLDHYQARGWKAWHHHMALVMMAMLFMLEERVEQQEDYPLLTCSDIETLLAHFLPRRDIDADEVIRQMELRHKKRQASIDSCFNKQQLE